MLRPHVPERVALGAIGPHGRGAVVFGLDPTNNEPTHVVPCIQADMTFTSRGWTRLTVTWADGEAADYTAYDLRVEGQFHRNRSIEES